MRRKEKIRELEKTIDLLTNQRDVTSHDPPERNYVENRISENQDQYKKLTGHYYSWRKP